MRRLIIISNLITLLATFEFQAQTPPQTTPGKPVLDPRRLAEEWVDRLNALDDWYVSVEGKEEGVEQLVNRMMELFAPDVLAEVPPHDEEQIGPVMLVGSGQVRKWLDSLARSQVNLEYILRLQTEKEFEGELLVYSTPLPWDGLGISFQIIGAYSLREDRRRFMAPGMVVLQFGVDGKIHRFRLYLTELGEVVPI